MKEREPWRVSPDKSSDSPARVRPSAKQKTGAANQRSLGLQQAVGNQEVTRLLHSGAIQARLHVSQPGDSDEIEADRIADQVVSAPAPATVHRKCSCPGGAVSCPACQEEEVEKAKGIHRKANRPSNEDLSVRDDFVHSLGPGQPLEPEVSDSMESRFGTDFKDVRVHTDSRAAASARSINAQAFTSGRNVVFGSNEYAPHTPAGRKLLAHELTHVVQQGKSSRTAGNIHRRVTPQDVSSEMVGRQFTVTGPFTSGAIQLHGGESVEVVTWSNSLDTATVQLPAPFQNAHQPFDIPKRLLAPDSPTARGISHYSAGVKQEEAAIQKGDQAIAQEQARKGGPRPGELPRLQGLQQNRAQTLNVKLIQETMMNRFDPVIRKWVDFYNQQFGFTGGKGKDALDANLVKSLLFQESQMGTSGQHLDIPTPGHPIHPVRSRFNIGQVIDTSGSALLLILREMQPALIAKHHLENLSHDLSAAQSELQHLKALPHLTSAQHARVAVLEPLSRRSWEIFIWTYKAPGQATGFNDAVQELFASPGAGQPALNLDYEFWIRAAIRWIFEKRRSVGSWAEAIRAYNGSGASAQHYRDAVVQRAQGSQQASVSGTEFVPSGI
jgi:hypothetical protein